jgi:hypothetical protein
MKRLIALAAITAGRSGGALLNAGLSSQAQAAGCYYGVYQVGVGMIGIDGNGHAAKHEWACNRARRECIVFWNAPANRPCFRAAVPAISPASATDRDDAGVCQPHFAHAMAFTIASTAATCFRPPSLTSVRQVK